MVAGRRLYQHRHRTQQEGARDDAGTGHLPHTGHTGTRSAERTRGQEAADQLGLSLRRRLVLVSVASVRAETEPLAPHLAPLTDAARCSGGVKQRRAAGVLLPAPAATAHGHCQTPVLHGPQPRFGTGPPARKGREPFSGGPCSAT